MEILDDRREYRSITGGETEPKQDLLWVYALNSDGALARPYCNPLLVLDLFSGNGENVSHRCQMCPLAR
jgi:hypothetical protein